MRQEHWRDTVRATLEQDLLLGQDPFETAGGRPDDDPDSLGAHGGNIERSVGHGFFGRDQGKLGAAVHVPQLFGRDVVLRLEVLDLAADLHAEGGGIEQGEAGDAGAAGKQV